MSSPQMSPPPPRATTQEDLFDAGTVLHLVELTTKDGQSVKVEIPVTTQALSTLVKRTREAIQAENQEITFMIRRLCAYQPDERDTPLTYMGRWALCDSDSQAYVPADSTEEDDLDPVSKDAPPGDIEPEVNNNIDEEEDEEENENEEEEEDEDEDNVVDASQASDESSLTSDFAEVSNDKDQHHQFAYSAKKRLGEELANVIPGLTAFTADVSQVRVRMTDARISHTSDSVKLIALAPAGSTTVTIKLKDNEVTYIIGWDRWNLKGKVPTSGGWISNRSRDAQDEQEKKDIHDEQELWLCMVDYRPDYEKAYQVTPPTIDTSDPEII
ncbi:hypothetical protein TREMEDRAFT_65093 [Tremella mesenterica DSM 1558]|uniref:uncharacterized protein n=1 Tax=Tremella mesenterica (strain ATCC 24925 / CBS 8224 / DSM 1558 / NBRC 9311 / NRRL Y-6157 / RJB 2259-6 / UBC 559-6) TaxID=578456 RepID=UPI00032CEC05|nr:uncharacterized protein TREMEDRAFT_65093 [Tremella mesenterica DSM 1558]EIW66700.1 hypothetical protein TREMEDRAFT_65093 [Tremella mesenterica DSM 1558]